MDCNHARLLLTFARDHADLDQSEADGLEEHLGQCPECAATAATERRVDAALGKAMNAVPVPPGLKQRILAKLPRTRLRWRRLIVSTVAAAAVLLLAVGFTWRTWLAPRPDPDWERIPFTFVNLNPKSPQEVETWFKDKQRLTMVFPRQFNSRRLNSISVADFQGQRVPKLEFLAKGDVAHVYVLSDRQFNVHADVQSHLRTTEVGLIETFKHSGFLYVVISTGSLDPFLNFQ